MPLLLSARFLTVLLALLLQIACHSSGTGGASPSPGPVKGPGPTPGPAPVRPESLISRLSPQQIEEVQTCYTDFYKFAVAEWSQIASAYLITCVIKVTPVTNSDWTGQFEKDFQALFQALDEKIKLGVP